jgi:hypothetical protein
MQGKPKRMERYPLRKGVGQTCANGEASPRLQAYGVRSALLFGKGRERGRHVPQFLKAKKLPCLEREMQPEAFIAIIEICAKDILGLNKTITTRCSCEQKALAQHA